MQAGWMDGRHTARGVFDVDLVTVDGDPRAMAL